jgi:hypothetical protein
LKFHVAHIIPDPKLHGLHGYKEVIESLTWGLEQLGHQVTFAVNKTSKSARNIIFGGQVMSVAEQKQLRPDSIFYNFEQLRGAGVSDVRLEIKHYAANFQVWDYSEFNLPAWTFLGTKYPVKHVPVGFAPLLERIERPASQPIDVLIYGMTNQPRLGIFHALCQKGLSCVFLCGLYGADRDELIARSKAIVNIGLYPDANIFEVVRVSYLLANRKAVVAYVDRNTAIEKDLVGGFQASLADSLIADVAAIVADEPRRRELEARGYEKIVKRDMGEILAKALSA